MPGLYWLVIDVRVFGGGGEGWGRRGTGGNVGLLISVSCTALKSALSLDNNASKETMIVTI